MGPIQYVAAHRGRLSRMLAIRTVPPTVVLITAFASYGALVVAGLEGLPLWAQVVAVLLPWIPLFTLEMAWTYKHYTWFALFYVLTFTQVGHVLEHMAQMWQIHVMHIVPKEAHGVFGALDTEWVHVFFNTFVIVAVVLLLRPYRQNAWLWVTAVIAGWHEIEHLYLIAKYIQTGLPGNPGLLAHGGVIFGAFPLGRPDLHMLYNVAETIPLVAAFVYQLRRVHDQWIGKALPRLPRRMLLDLTGRADVVTVAANTPVLTQGQPSHRFYVVARGTVESLRTTAEGKEIVVGTLGPGQFFGENAVTQAPSEATIRTVTKAELLALDRSPAKTVADYYEATRDPLAAAFNRASHKEMVRSR
jgi:hypothetical protein